MDVEKAKEKEKAKEREREKSRERGKEKETERARNKEERERRENGTQNRRSPTPPSVPRGPQQRDSALHHTVALPPPTGPRSYERPTAPPPSLHPRPSSPKKPLPNEPARTDDHRSRPSHPPLSATSPPSTSEANSSAPASSIPTAAATPTTAIPPPSEAEPTAQPVLPPSGELYERLVQVGEGTYGKVYKARNVETGSLVALKRIRMEQERDGFPVTSVREIKLLQCLRHRNVVDLIEMMVSKGHVYMVFEYLDHDLTGVLHHPSINLTPAHLKSLMKQFLEGLGFIHRRGVLHRDLKGSNILLGRRGELKIADFGLARFYARGRQNDYTNRVITQWYKPPELLFGATVYGAEVDMWSAGCIFLELFSRRPIFQGQDEIHQLDVIFKITGTPKVDTWPGVQDLPWYELVKPKSEKDSELRSMFSKWLSPAGLDIAEALLSLNPANRPTADEALQMDYFFEDPQPEMPAVLADVKGEWHELESKRARKRQREEAGQP
ncbi:Pkinase-domain-containing protein [Meredithblackwellia eburnea MCA 4105]